MFITYYYELKLDINFIITLYFEVDDNSESLPGTEQNISVGCESLEIFSFAVKSSFLKQKG